MLYIGHFNFDRKRTGEEGNFDGEHGYFTCVAEAEDIESALEILKALIQSLHKRELLFDPSDNIYLDSCVEIKSMPREGFLAHYVSLAGEHPGSVSTSATGASEECVTAYGDNDEEDDRGNFGAKKFVTLVRE